MIPLVLVALGIGVFAIYEMSAHDRSVKDATDATDASQAHVAIATVAATHAYAAVPSMSAQGVSAWKALKENLAAANAATKAAAEKAAVAAKTAALPREKAIAALVADRTSAIQDQVKWLSIWAAEMAAQHRDTVIASARTFLADANARIERADADLLRFGAPTITQPVTDMVSAAMKSLGVSVPASEKASAARSVDPWV